MKKFTYKVFDDGYDIYRDGEIIITQRVPYDKMFLPNGTYEENAEAHIATLDQPPVPYAPTEGEKLRADVDYLALMTDVDLPSQQEEEV